MIAQVSDRHQAETSDGFEAKVRRRLGNQVRDFRLIFLGESLVLSGQATTYYAKQLAQHAIWSEMRAAFVVNNIEVVADLT